METIEQSSVAHSATLMKAFTAPYPPLEQVTKPSLNTAEYAYYTGIAPQTARIHACKGCGPLRPIRLPGSSLLRWPTKATKQLLGVS